MSRPRSKDPGPGPPEAGSKDQMLESTASMGGLTRDEVLDVRSLVTVAEITTSMRGLAAEVTIDDEPAGLDHESAINCDGLHTVPQSMLTKQVGTLDANDLERVCAAVRYALGC